MAVMMCIEVPTATGEYDFFHGSKNTRSSAMHLLSVSSSLWSFIWFSIIGNSWAQYP